MTETPGWSSPDQQPNQPPQQPPPGHYHAPPPPPAQPTIKPGVIPLRPLAVGEIIDGAVTTMRKYPKLIFGPAAVVAAVTQIVGLLVQLPFLRQLTSLATLDPNRVSQQQAMEQLTQSVTQFFTGAVISSVLAVLGTVFLSGFITVVAGHAVLGKPVTFARVWAEFRPRLLPLLVATVLFGFAAGAAVVLFLVSGVLLGALVDSVSVFVAGLLLAIVAGVWLWVLFSLVTPALVLERCGIVTAFGRSRSLVKGAWWRTFGILLLAVLISVVIGWIISLPFGALNLAVSGFGSDPAAVLSTGALAVAAIGGIIASTITLPFRSAVNVLVYVDRRMRAEGMDIELQRAAGHGGS